MGFKRPLPSVTAVTHSWRPVLLHEAFSAFLRPWQGPRLSSLVSSPSAACCMLQQPDYLSSSCSFLLHACLPLLLPFLSYPALFSWLGHPCLLKHSALVITHSFILLMLTATCLGPDVVAGLCHLPLLPPCTPRLCGCPL